MNRSSKSFLISFALLFSFSLSGQDHYIDTLRIDIYGHLSRSKEFVISCSQGEYQFEINPSMTVVNHGTIRIALKDSFKHQSSYVLDVKKRYLWFFWKRSQNILVINKDEKRCVLLAEVCGKESFDNYWEHEIPSTLLLFYPYMATDRRVYRLIQQKPQ